MKDEKYEFIRGENGKVSIAGLGSYGQVKLARNTQTKEIVAIKMIQKNAKEQIDVHHKLNHPNIVKLLNYNYDKQKNVTYMVLQYAENGTLSDKIKFGLGQLPKSLIMQYFKDVCEAMHYVHANHYMHRDIKPENILLTRDNHAKLCDFGFAAILEYRSTLCGTHEYMSPEMIQKKAYDYKIDIWALGILLFEMIQGTAPFRGETGEEVLAEMKKPIAFSNRFEPEQIDLIKKILRVNSDNRPKVQQILQHPYFKALQNRDIIFKQQELGQKLSAIEQQSFRKRNNSQSPGLARDSDKHQQQRLDYRSKSGIVDQQQKPFRPYIPKSSNDPRPLLKSYTQNSNNLFNGTPTHVVGSVNSSMGYPSSQPQYQYTGSNGSIRYNTNSNSNILPPQQSYNSHGFSHNTNSSFSYSNKQQNSIYNPVHNQINPNISTSPSTISQQTRGLQMGGIGHGGYINNIHLNKKTDLQDSPTFVDQYQLAL